LTTVGQAKLIEAMDAQRLVRFWNPFESHFDRGYVLDVGPSFFLLASVSDRIRHEGFQCLRIADVRRLVADPSTTFIEAALKARGGAVPPKPPIDLSSIGAILTSGSAAFPLATIHCETQDADACRIGRVLSVRGGRVSLLEITPRATWDDEPTAYALSAITRVGFGEDYEEALYLVSGEPPPRATVAAKGSA
jgi:hypothetical protein